MIRLGTLFSGIGAIEQALIRMNEEHKIVFACDNGEIELKLLPVEEQAELDKLRKISKKHITPEENDRLLQLNEKENSIIDNILNYVKQLHSTRMRPATRARCAIRRTRSCYGK